MKKIFVFCSFLVLFTAFTCDDEPLEGDFVTEDPTGSSCQEAILATAQAALAFVEVTDENYTQLCNAYRTAIENQITACGDTDGSLTATLNALGDCTNNSQGDVEPVGEWLLTEWNIEEPEDIDGDGTANTNLVVELDCYQNERLVFNANNTGVNMSTSYAELSFEIEVGTTDSYIYSSTCIDEIENTSFTWSQSGNTVTITDELNNTYDYTINGNQMTVVIPDGHVVSNGDFTVTVIQDLTFVYVKQ